MLPAVRVLVTGANGSVGSAVVERFLRDGHRVHAFVRGPCDPPGGEVFRGDIADRGALAAAARGVQLVVHCAASVTADRDTNLRVNVDGMRCLVETLVAGDRPRLIHLSTVSVYDDAAGPDYDEDSALWTSVEGEYGFTKAAAARVLTTVGRELDATILRPALILSMHARSRLGPARRRTRAVRGRLPPPLSRASLRSCRQPRRRHRARGALPDGASTRLQRRRGRGRHARVPRCHLWRSGEAPARDSRGCASPPLHVGAHPPRAQVGAPRSLARVRRVAAPAPVSPLHRAAWCSMVAPHLWRGGRVAEGGGLLNRYRVKSPIEGSNPSLSSSSFFFFQSSRTPGNGSGGTGSVLGDSSRADGGGTALATG